MAYTTINKSSLHMNTKTFTGNGGTQSITGINFQPDMTWLKKRNGTANHHLVDAVRGAGYYLYGNLTNAQGGSGNSLLTSFNTDGFTLDLGADSNASGATGVSWNWKANGAGSANTAGGINSTVSVNTTSGFSIVKYTGNGSSGSTVGHGLGSVPQMIITKRLTSGDDWIVQHHKITTGNPWDDQYCMLNSTAGRAGSYSVSGGYTPTSSLIYLGSDGRVNGNGQDYISYVFVGKTGYSKFGSYTGNDNADGTFVYTGMKPAFVMLKNTDRGEDWLMHDNKRDIDNLVHSRIAANEANADYNSDSNGLDFLSNGFKIRTSSSAWNYSGNNLIYMCFAEAPLVGTNNVPCTAR